MGIGIAFTFLLIATLVAPLVWIAWWAAGSFGGNGRVALAPAVPSRKAGTGVATRRSAFERPRPADLSLPRRTSSIAMYTGAGAELASCSGPDHSGRCPRTAAGGAVPCAGLVLSLPRPVSGSTEWHIPSGYRACMLGSYDAFRQPAGTPQH